MVTGENEHDISLFGCKLCQKLALYRFERDQIKKAHASKESAIGSQVGLLRQDDSSDMDSFNGNKLSSDKEGAPFIGHKSPISDQIPPQCQSPMPYQSPRQGHSSLCQSPTQALQSPDDDKPLEKIESTEEVYKQFSAHDSVMKYMSRKQDVQQNESLEPPHDSPKLDQNSEEHLLFKDNLSDKKDYWCSFEDRLSHDYMEATNEQRKIKNSKLAEEYWTELVDLLINHRKSAQCGYFSEGDQLLTDEPSAEASQICLENELQTKSACVCSNSNLSPVAIEGGEPLDTMQTSLMQHILKENRETDLLGINTISKDDEFNIPLIEKDKENGGLLMSLLDASLEIDFEKQPSVENCCSVTHTECLEKNQLPNIHQFSPITEEYLSKMRKLGESDDVKTSNSLEALVYSDIDQLCEANEHKVEIYRENEVEELLDICQVPGSLCLIQEDGLTEKSESENNECLGKIRLPGEILNQVPLPKEELPKVQDHLSVENEVGKVAIKFDEHDLFPVHESSEVEKKLEEIENKQESVKQTCEVAEVEVISEVHQSQESETAPSNEMHGVNQATTALPLIFEAERLVTATDKCRESVSHVKDNDNRGMIDVPLGQGLLPDEEEGRELVIADRKEIVDSYEESQLFEEDVSNKD